VKLDVLVDRRWAELEEESGEGRAPRATIKPEDNWVILGIVPGLEEP
jgi:hypothetical protein